MQNKTVLAQNFVDLAIPTMELVLFGVGTYFGAEVSTITDCLAA